MNGYDQQLKELLAQCARKKKLEASAAELRRQRDTYAARAEELKRPCGRSRRMWTGWRAGAWPPSSTTW